jgi:L-alanine-DL-glutamate epimerase-like enolase superfamily enzyme
MVVNPVSAFAAAITLTDRPGLGVEVDWENVKRYRVQ